MSPNYSGPPFDRAAWFAKHTPEETREIIAKVINALKEDGVELFGATGYCWGGKLSIIRFYYPFELDVSMPWPLGRFTFDLAFENTIKAAATSHPSLLKIPEDLEVGTSFSFVGTDADSDLTEISLIFQSTSSNQLVHSGRPVPLRSPS